jgi:hypothetical protein
MKFGELSPRQDHRFHCQYNVNWQRWDFYIGDREGNRWALVMMERQGDLDQQKEREPSYSFTEDDMQDLMDELWNAGARPTGVKGMDNGQAAAIKDEVIAAKDLHIGDLRLVVQRDSL